MRENFQTDKNGKDIDPKIAAAEKVAAEKVAAEKVAAEKVAAEKVAAEKAKKDGMPMWQKVVAGIALGLAVILLIYVIYKVIPRGQPTQQAPVITGGKSKCGKMHKHKASCKYSKGKWKSTGGGCGCGGVQLSQPNQ